MRFMMLMIPKGYGKAAPGFTPDAKAVRAMMEYNASLKKAGVLLALDGLHPLSMGARVAFAGGRPEVALGPFPEAAETLGGYWMIEAGSLKEAVAWARRCPAAEGDVIEVRQVSDISDFSSEVQEVMGKYPELAARFGGRRQGA